MSNDAGTVRQRGEHSSVDGLTLAIHPPNGRLLRRNARTDIFSMMNETFNRQKIILFDGVCNLCNSLVTFILPREKEPVFQFAPIQSESGKELLEWCGLPKNYRQAVVLVDQGNVYLGSTAALKIGQTLKFPWSVFASMGFAVPAFIRDWAYAQIAKHRYPWFGKRDVCMVPTKELQDRFWRS